MDNSCDELSAYTSNPPLYESVIVAHSQPHIDRLLKMKNHEQVKQEDETRLTKNWRTKITIPGRHYTHKDEIVQFLSMFEHMWDGLLAHIKTAKHRIKSTSKKYVQFTALITA